MTARRRRAWCSRSPRRSTPHHSRLAPDPRGAVGGQRRFVYPDSVSETASERSLRMSEPNTTGRHWPATAVHVDAREWELLRWPGQWSKMLVHPTAEHPTNPNAGLVRYEPGSHHPFHKHEFAQVWYILE